MKIRDDFVTNSSSSSFIAIYDDNNAIQLNPSYVVGKQGQIRFDRHYEVFNDFSSKLNFITIFAYFNNKQSLDIIKEIVFETSNIQLNFKHIFQLIQSYDAYIDHQTLNNSNIKKILQDKQILKNFLYNPKSLLIMGSDEEEWPKDAQKSFIQCIFLDDCIVIWDEFNDIYYFDY